MKPVSIVIPTLNSARTLSHCLDSIVSQDFPRRNFEIIVADAGSSDDTRAIAQSKGVDSIVANPLKTGEAGKAEGIRASSGEILVLIDSDNVLDSPSWLSLILAPFDDPSIFAAEPMEYTVRKIDPPLVRYFAMLGMSDPLCLFLGNYDRTSMITGRWTGIDLPFEDRKSYLKLTLNSDSLPTIGANGFAIRRSVLKDVIWHPYFFDIDIVHQAVLAGHINVAKVRNGVVHLYCQTLTHFARKQKRRINDYLFFTRSSQRTYPWKKRRTSGLIRFCLSCLIVVPLLVQMTIGFLRRPDPAWLYHVPVCWITLWTYGIAVLRKCIGLKPRAYSRSTWSQ